MQRAEQLYSFLLKVASQNSRGVSPKIVHRLRTTSRRLQSILAVQANGDDKLYKQLRKIRRQAGKVRDLDVQLAALKALEVPAAAAEQGRVATALQRKRRKTARSLREFLTDYRRRLRKAFPDKQAASAPSIPGANVSVTPGPNPLLDALSGFAAASRAHKVESAGDLHAFRIAAKKARYTAELAGDVPESANAIAALKQVQDAIGEWHDWTLLASTADELLGHPSNSPLLKAIQAEVRARLAHARRTITLKTRLLLETHAALSGAKRPPARRSAPSPAVRAM
jgi:CHAD domain-containing protein